MLLVRPRHDREVQGRLSLATLLVIAGLALGLRDYGGQKVGLSKPEPVFGTVVSFGSAPSRGARFP